MTQPSWQCIANLGDVDPYTYGGAFVMVDRRGIYDPELWVWDPDDGDTDRPAGVLYMHVMGQCVAVPGNPAAISDNIYHPDHPAWWSDDLPAVCSSCDVRMDQMRDWLLSSDPVQRAMAWRNLLWYHGCAEHGDEHGRRMKPAEGRRYCDRLLRSIEQSKKLKDGF